MEILTKSAQETENLGESIGRSLIKKARLRSSADGLRRGKRRGERATLLTLSGELGSGKTTFVRGLAKALGLKNRILSPTFILSREYPLDNLPFQKFIHIDLYRLSEKVNDESLGLDEILADSANLVVIEWPERLGSSLPEESIEVKFQHKPDSERLIVIQDLE